MPTRLKQYANAMPKGTGGREVRKMFEAVVADNAALRTKYAALLAKLDADSGVGDTNYASTLALPAATLTA